MLANGATLQVKKASGMSYESEIISAWTEWQNLDGLKQLPDMGVDPEKVENTTLTDTVKQYENGIGDSGDMTYTFKYDNSTATSAYRLMREAEKEGKKISFKETLKDGTETTFDAQVAVKRSSAGVNGALEFTIALSLQSAIAIKDPEVSA